MLFTCSSSLLLPRACCSRSCVPLRCLAVSNLSSWVTLLYSTNFHDIHSLHTCLDISTCNARSYLLITSDQIANMDPSLRSAKGMQNEIDRLQSNLLRRFTNLVALAKVRYQIQTQTSQPILTRQIAGKIHRSRRLRHCAISTSSRNRGTCKHIPFYATSEPICCKLFFCYSFCTHRVICDEVAY